MFKSPLLGECKFTIIFSIFPNPGRIFYTRAHAVGLKDAFDNGSVTGKAAGCRSRRPVP